MSITLEEKGLYLQLSEQQVYFNYYWLRDNCPSSFDPQTRERIFDICELAFAPVPASADVDDEQLLIHWNSEDHVSRYPLSLLTGWAERGGRNDPAALPRKLWYHDHYAEFTRLDFSQLQSREPEKIRWAKALLEEGVALVTGMPDTDAGLTELANMLGSVRASVAGDYFEVKVHRQPVNLSYTAAALEMHTDTPAEELPPGIQYLHCRLNSAEGGDSLFMDGVAAATDFRQEFPAAFELLINTRIPFFYEHDKFDWRAYQRVIELDDQGEISGVTVSQHMADSFDLPQEQLDDYYPAFVSFLKFINQPQYLVRFRLNQGECIVFDNHRVIHGRSSYDPGTGDRHLRGCYTDRGELRSYYRAWAVQSEVSDVQI